MLYHNELFDYIEQLGFEGAYWGTASITPLTYPSEHIVFSHLDYISIRYPAPLRYTRVEDWLMPYPQDLFRTSDRKGGGMGYAHSYSVEPAGRYFYDGWKAELGSLIVLQGDDLARSRAVLKISDDELLARMLQNAEAVTRIDFATNISTGSPDEARDEIRQKRIVTKVRKALGYEPLLEEDNSGVRIGSKDSNKFVRIYDKAAELKLLHTVLTRIELQTRHAPADRLARLMRFYGVKDVGKAAIRKHCDFPKLRWFQDAVSGRDVDMQLTPREEGNLMNWLTEHVSPAMRKRIDRGELHSEIRDWLHAEYEYLIRGK